MYDQDFKIPAAPNKEQSYSSTSLFRVNEDIPTKRFKRTEEPPTPRLWHPSTVPVPSELGSESLSESGPAVEQQPKEPPIKRRFMLPGQSRFLLPSQSPDQDSLPFIFPILQQQNTAYNG